MRGQDPFYKTLRIEIVQLFFCQQLITANKALAGKLHTADEKFYLGKLQAMQYFFRFDLPEIYVWSKILCDLDDTSYCMQADWF